jgi:DNA polymerase
VLDEALERAGIAPREVYRTNAVKHFKWRPTSTKKRLHDRPDRNEIEICKPWLMAEIQLVGPQVVVALGATAAMSLLGKRVSIARQRGEVHDLDGVRVVVTYHPSLVLRRREDKQERMAELVADLQRVRALLRGDLAVGHGAHAP